MFAPSGSSLHFVPFRSSFAHFMPWFFRMYRGDTDGQNFVAMLLVIACFSRGQPGLMTRCLRGKQYRPLSATACELLVEAEARTDAVPPATARRNMIGLGGEHQTQRRGTRLPSGARSRCRGATSCLGPVIFHPAQDNNNQRRRHPVTVGRPSRCRGATEIPGQHTRREGPRRRPEAGSGPSRRATAGFILQHYTLRYNAIHFHTTHGDVL